MQKNIFKIYLQILESEKIGSWNLEKSYILKERKTLEWTLCIYDQSPESSPQCLELIQKATVLLA